MLDSLRQEFTIASANVHFGDAVRADGGLEPVGRHAPDILLLQEVTNPKVELELQLGKANYNLVHAAGEFGLAMAIYSDSERLCKGRSGIATPMPSIEVCR